MASTLDGVEWSEILKDVEGEILSVLNYDDLIKYYSFYLKNEVEE